MAIREDVETAALDVIHVSKHFDRIQALRDVSVAFRPGEVHAIVGENGAGKSTLVKIIAGVYGPDGGNLLRNGQSIAFSSPRAAIDAGIAVVYQEPSLLPFLTVEENLLLGHEPRTPLGLVRTQEMRRQARRYLEIVGGDIPPDAALQELTIPERQLVEIARALSLDAHIVLMDEPTSSLSIKEFDRLKEVINRLKAGGISVVFISHDLAEVFAVADRVTVLKDGEVTLSSAAADTEVDEVVRAMVGRSLAHLFPPREPAPADSQMVLEVRDLTVPGRVKNVSFELRAGEVTGFIGLIGAGRSDVARAIFGAARSRQGEVLLDGKPIRVREPIEAVELGIAFVPEDRQAEGLVLDMPVSQNISLPQLARLAKWGLLDRRRERQLARQQIEAMNIRASGVQTAVRELSGGNQQKVVLSKWLARGCRVLLLDEPTRGIDVGAKVEIYELIRGLAAQGAAVMLISSELPEILHLADRIVVMAKGRVVADVANEVRTEADVAAEEKMIRSALGLESKDGPEGEQREGIVAE